MHDIAVIGLGMMGAAATRHLASMGVNVLGVGPGEPADWQAHNGVFASHYDQGRITRILDPDPVWGRLAQRSIPRYAEIEAKTGVKFHFPVGGLRATPDTSDPTDTVESAQRIGREWGVDFDTLDRVGLAQYFPYWAFPETATGLWERGEAGYINPRSLVKAQLIAAIQNGAELVQETVVGLKKEDGSFVITTDRSSSFRANKVLIAGGGYTNHLLERPLDLRPKAVTVLLGEVNEAEQARLAGMPTLIYRLPQDDYLYSIYALPPIAYPDGKTYIKIGGMAWECPLIHHPEQFVAWFHGDGNPTEVEALHRSMLSLIPDLRVEAWRTTPCVLTYTASGFPYADQVDDNLFVVTGGNGSAAKSSDEIGRVGALLAANGSWVYDLDATHFKAHLRPDGPLPKTVKR